ncbi:MAG: 6-phosphogluconolactonase [Elusimicrobia bacterium GWA2_69_24]|nr:MAG: 6-phosphogluconolactonase [Elusimicrobia bacterium GWA2_69_24]
MLRCYPDEAAVALAAAEFFAKKALAAIDLRGVFRVAISGGATPLATYRLLASPVSVGLPWSKIHVYWVDERYVPADSAESNYRMARESWLSHVPIPAENIHPMLTLGGDPSVGAAAYEAALRIDFPEQPWPRFDLVLLGLGGDGHTASLFPGDAALMEKRRWVCAAYSPVGVRSRITLTLPVLNRARLRMCLVCGRGKADVLRRVIERETHPLLPAQLLHRTLYFADSEAAARLFPD